MLRNSHQHLWTRNNRRGERLHPYGNIIIATIQPHRTFVLSKYRCKTPNLNSQNYYDLLGVERTATKKEIRKAFLKLSKEYHPDSNATDKSLHEKFVKINAAFGVLSKQSSRSTYDQTIQPSSQSYPRRYSSPPQPTNASTFDWTSTPFSTRGNSQRQSKATNESDWGTPHFDKTFFDLLRRRIEQDRQRAKQSPRPQPPSFGLLHDYFAPFSIISFLIAFGTLLYALQWRMPKFTDENINSDPRSRRYLAYREWQRLSSLKEAESIPMRESTTRRGEEK